MISPNEPASADKRKDFDERDHEIHRLTNVVSILRTLLF